MSTLLHPGATCWRTAQAKRVRFLVDAAAYYEAFAETAEKAQKRITIASWDINGQITLHPKRPKEQLRAFFLRLLRKNPRLHIYILNWKYPAIYAANREVLPLFDHAWRIHPRLHFEWDADHPAGACHHQKIVVIDDHISFVGGLDFTHERWDTPRHRPWAQHRFHDGERYLPFHDTVVMAQGPVAQALGALFRQRWERHRIRHRRKHPKLLTITPARIPWPPAIPVDLKNVSVGICRTEQGFDKHIHIREIEQHYLALMAAAQRFIYIENQYFTAERIVQALALSLRRRRGPEIVLILPKGCTGWFEEVSMGAARSRAIAYLRSRDRFKRLHVYHPFIQGLNPDYYLKVHDKLIIVDDKYLHLGSANLCNRSMELDTECDLALESQRKGDTVERAIQHLRERLLAEHLGTKPRLVHEIFLKMGSLAKTIRELDNDQRTLVEFDGKVAPLAEVIGKNLISVETLRPYI